MKTIFWILSALVVYCYLGYPLLISLISRFCPKPVRAAPIVPDISIVISVYNEGDVINQKIANLLAQDYPLERMNIYIGSDGSTDNTNAILKNLNHPRIHPLIHEERRGKMSVINDLVAQCATEIVVFNDARQTLDKSALRYLVMNFADPQVGCVSGELVFTATAGQTAKGINLYWEYEKFIRGHESRVHSMLGATGAFYGIRRGLFVPGPQQVVLDDMFIPLKIIQQGFRVVFDNQAHAYDKAAEDHKEEHRRKARTSYGNYQIFLLFPGLFNPFKSPVAIQFFSHKLLRIIVPFILITLFFLNTAQRNDPLFHVLFITQVIFYTMAVLGRMLNRQKNKLARWILKLCAIPYVFCLLNYSALCGLFRFLRANQRITWEKARQS